MKILTVIGARPQFIKAALVSKRLRKRGFEEKLVHTGQHYDFNMSDIFFRDLGLPEPDYHLSVCGGNHGDQTGRMLIEIEKVLEKEKPDLALVYGDTNSTLAGSLAAAKLHVPVAHVEAGLRSYNRRMPEELNRVMTDHVSEILFCPTATGIGNLVKEGFIHLVNEGKLIDIDASCSESAARSPGPIVINVGDVMLDIALKMYAGIDEDRILDDFRLKPKEYCLATIHRAENTDSRERLEAIWRSLLQIASESGLPLFFPLHPRTRNALRNAGLPDGRETGLVVHEPVSYKEMLALEKNAKLVITDSGGVQKEAYFLKTPVVIPRNETEWVELVESRWAVLTGPDVASLGNVALDRLEELDGREGPPWMPYYGDGNAVGRIVNFVGGYLQVRPGESDH